MNISINPALNNPDTVEKEEPAVEQKQEAAAVVKVTSSEDTPFTASQKVPSNWTLRNTDEEDIIEANHVNGRVFVGTIADFNKALRA